MANLNDAVRYPTPTATDSRGHGYTYDQGDPTKKRLTLTGVARQWPTPDASAANLNEKPETWLARQEKLNAKGYNGNGAGMPLAIAAQLWPTPTAALGDTKRGLPSSELAAKRLEGGRRNLDDAVVLATPTARDWRSGKASEATHAKNSRPLSEQIGGQLNPTWVEWLMGFPLEWSACADWATRKSRCKPRPPSPS